MPPDGTATTQVANRAPDGEVLGTNQEIWCTYGEVGTKHFKVGVKRTIAVDRPTGRVSRLERALASLMARKAHRDGGEVLKSLASKFSDTEIRESVTLEMAKQSSVSYDDYLEMMARETDDQKVLKKAVMKYLRNADESGTNPWDLGVYIAKNFLPKTDSNVKFWRDFLVEQLSGQDVDDDVDAVHHLYRAPEEISLFIDDWSPENFSNVFIVEMVESEFLARKMDDMQSDEQRRAKVSDWLEKAKQFSTRQSWRALSERAPISYLLSRAIRLGIRRTVDNIVQAGNVMPSNQQIERFLEAEGDVSAPKKTTLGHYPDVQLDLNEKDAEQYDQLLALCTLAVAETTKQRVNVIGRCKKRVKFVHPSELCCNREQEAKFLIAVQDAYALDKRISRPENRVEDEESGLVRLNNALSVHGGNDDREIQQTQKLSFELGEAITSDKKRGVVGCYDDKSYWIVKYTGSKREVYTPINSRGAWLLRHGELMITRLSGIISPDLMYRDFFIGQLEPNNIVRASRLKEYLRDVPTDEHSNLVAELVLKMAQQGRSVVLKPGLHGCLLKAASMADIPMPSSPKSNKKVWWRTKRGKIKEPVIYIDQPIWASLRTCGTISEVKYTADLAHCLTLRTDGKGRRLFHISRRDMGTTVELDDRTEDVATGNFDGHTINDVDEMVVLKSLGTALKAVAQAGDSITGKEGDETVKSNLYQR